MSLLALMHGSSHTLFTTLLPINFHCIFNLFVTTRKRQNTNKFNNILNTYNLNITDFSALHTDIRWYSKYLHNDFFVDKLIFLVVHEEIITPNVLFLLLFSAYLVCIGPKN